MKRRPEWLERRREAAKKKARPNRTMLRAAGILPRRYANRPLVRTTRLERRIGNR